MPLDKRDQGLLLDIRQAALDIRTFTAGMSETAYLNDRKTQKAVERELEIMGEASGKLSPKARDAYPKVPFSKIRGLRNILAHDYGNINHQRIWQTLTDELPGLLKELR